MPIIRLLISITILLSLLFPNFVQAQLQERPIVRLIYFVPRDRQPQPNINADMDRVIKQVQQHYLEQMERLGYGKKTFKLEIDANGKVVVHHVKGKFSDSHYRFDTFWKISDEISKSYDTSKNVYFIAANTSEGFESGVLGRGRICGLGGPFTLIKSNDECLTTDYGFQVAAHELGHTFGLQHDFSNDTYLMSYGGGTDLSPCDAEWLDVHRAFNPSRLATNKETKIEMLPPSLASPPNSIRFHFKITDPEGVHQARLHTKTLSGSATGYLEVVSCKGSNGKPNTTVELVTTHLGPKNRSVSLQVIDVNGNFTMSQEFSVNIASILPRPEVVSIPDVHLAAAVQREIGSSITTLTIHNLTRLDARNRGITNLKGLEHAHNLKYLNLNGEYIEGKGVLNSNNISDLSPLMSLPHLTAVYLSNNAVSDISSLSKMIQLDQLDLSNNAISDVSPLSKMTELTYLTLSNNAISDVSPLSKMTDLTQLHLSKNSISDVSPLAGLTQLTFLNLSDNEISDISMLAEMTQLTFLYIRNNRISDVSPLAKLTQLKVLYLTNNAITDVSPLVGLNLTGTQLHNNGLYLRVNPLSYASIKTHIPAMQAKGIAVDFDGRAHPTLLKISGDAQENEAGMTLADPFVVEAQDKNGEPMRGVDLTFTVTAGGGSQGGIVAPIITTDANGRAQTTLTLGQASGTNKVTVTAKGLPEATFSAIATTPSNPTVAADVNGDGVVDNQDVDAVTAQVGEQGENAADVNGDGVVNIMDVILVAGIIDGDAGAPALYPSLLSNFSLADIQQWLDEAKQLGETDVVYLRGIAILEQLLIALIPKKTVLLANYPNPFNPETWIPYQLARPSEVTLHIYAVNGALVRTLALGHQAAGMYHSKSRAAYWDGRNEQGERVASGIYFYMLSAGDFAATRKMLIRK